MKRSEYISAFLDFVREAQIEYDVARMKQSEADSETQDILHRLELHDDSYHDMARLSKTLKEARQDRRAAKDAISELDPICGWVRENARVLKSLEQLLGNVRKAEKATQNRYYSDRTDLLRSHFYKQRYLDGSRKLDGSRTLSYSVGQIELLPDYLFQTETQVSFMVQAFTEYTALAEHKTVQDQEYEVLMNARYLRNTDVLVSLASDFLFRVRETWKWHPEARNEYHMAARQEQDITPVYGIRMTTIFFPARHLDGSRKLDGSRTLSGAIGRIEGDTGYLLDVQNKIIKTTEQELENVMDVQMNVLPEATSTARMTVKFWYGRRLDGSRKLDGSRTLSTLTGRIEARKDYLFDVYTVAQGSGSIG